MIAALAGPAFGAGLEITRASVFSGVMVGLVTGLLGVGIVLIYRTSRVINFAYGEIGIFGASLLGILVLSYGWNYWVALTAASVVGGLVSLSVELVVVRRLFTAPRVVLFAATLGVSQLVFAATLALPTADPGPFPSPFFVQPSRADPEASYSLFGLGVPFEIVGVRVLGRDLLVLLLVPAIIAVLAWAMNRTLAGLAIRAAASNADGARLAGVSPRLASTAVWTVAGLLAVVTAALLLPLLGTQPGPQAQIIGPGLLLRALTAALVGRMRSIAGTMIGGIALGVIEGVVLFNTGTSRLLLNTPGFFFVLLFAAVLILVLFQARSGSIDTAGTWSFTPQRRSVTASIRDRGPAAGIGHVIGGLALVAGLLYPLLETRSSKLSIVTTALLWAVVGLSVTVLTGWAGQLSLGQFAFAGLGAMTTGSVTARGIPWGGGRLWSAGAPFAVAVVVAVAVCVVAAVLIGAPALRVHGLFLAVTTLAFAVACSGWLFRQDVFLESGQTSVFVPRPAIVESARAYYWLCLAVLVAAMLLAARLRRTGIGRSLVAVRDNERGAAAFTVSPARSKFTAFALGGGLAGLAGALLAGLSQNADPNDYGVTESLAVISMTIVGGVTAVAGPLLGALWVQALPAAVDFSEIANLVRSGIGLLVMLLFFPGGLVQIARRVADALAKQAVGPDRSRRTPGSPPISRRTDDRQEAPETTLEPVLATIDVAVSFGGKRAVDGVSIEAGADEIVGLIGTNGAGKTTLMNAIGGFVTNSGRIEIDGNDVTGLAPHERARAGLGRTFQRASLFGGLTVRETIELALEARSRTELTSTLLALPRYRRPEQRKRQAADELIGYVGLAPYADRSIAELSTGTRRVCELSCLLALDARLLCLDEPTAGLAQREAEAFGPLITRIREELGATLLVIEHDIPLIMSISDRVYCLEAGRLIAEGSPDAVRRDPVVVASYLGPDGPVDEPVVVGPTEE